MCSIIRAQVDTIQVMSKGSYRATPRIPIFALTIAVFLAACDPVPRRTFTVTYELTMDENIDLISLQYRNSEGNTVSAEPSSGNRAGIDGWDADGENWTTEHEGVPDDAAAFVAVRPRDTEEAMGANVTVRILVDGITEREHSFADAVDSEVTDTRGEGMLFEDGVLQLTQYLRRIRWRP